MVDNTEPPYRISLSVQTDDRSWRSARTPTVLQPATWYHVAGVFDGEVGETTIFVDGTQLSQTSGNPCRIGPGSNTICIGVRDNGAYLNGALDDVRVYDRALAPQLIEEIAARKTVTDTPD